MTVFYETTRNDPNEVGWFPESVVNSVWFTNMAAYVEPNGYYGNTGHSIIIKFPDMETLNSWVATYTCTDPTVISEMELWKSAHGITYTTTIYADGSETVTTNLVG